MGLSFSFAKRPLEPTGRRPKVLVTGAAGRIGSFFAEHSHGNYDLRLMVREEDKKEDIAAIARFGAVVSGHIEDLPRMKEFCDGMDTVLHLAANASANATWDILLNTNIIGTYNTFAAAKAAGCRRVIFASSIHAVSGYPADVQVKTSDPVNPGDLYGVSKCFGEALARYMAEKEELSAIALRIGGCQPLSFAQHENSLFMLDAFVSHRDLNHLIEKCIDDTRLQFAIFNALSDNRFKRLDIADARELVGYAPQDDFTRENPKLKPLQLPRKVVSHSMADAEQESGLRKDVGKKR